MPVRFPYRDTKRVIDYPGRGIATDATLRCTMRYGIPHSISVQPWAVVRILVST